MSETINLTVQENSPVSLSTEQARVIAAVSPTVDAERVTGGVQITVEDYRETPQTVTLYDGQTGATGQTGPAGADGYSPSASVSKSGSTATITITDKTGTTTATVSDGSPGQNGQDGSPGQNGVSPTISSESITGGHRLTITDAQGETTVDVMDGTDGQNGAPGADGYSPTASVSKSGSTATITITDRNGTTTAQVSDGQSGEMVVETVSGTTPSITAVANHRYICGECSTLSITVPASGCIDVLFESGTTATVLTVTSAKTGVTAIKWANGFDATSLDASTTYEINILDGEFGVVGSWT